MRHFSEIRHAPVLHKLQTIRRLESFATGEVSCALFDVSVVRKFLSSEKNSILKESYFRLEI